jgi:hypothetical protein
MTFLLLILRAVRSSEASLARQRFATARHDGPELLRNRCEILEVS